MDNKNYKKLMQFLEQLDSKKFNFNQVVTAFNKTKECGSVCCVVGWFPDVFRNCLWFESTPSRIDVKIEIGDTVIKKGFVDVAAYVLDIPKEHASCLFSPYDGIICIDEDHDTIDIDGELFESVDDAIVAMCEDAKMKTIQLCNSNAEISDVMEMLEEYYEVYKNDMPIMGKV